MNIKKHMLKKTILLIITLALSFFIIAGAIWFLYHPKINTSSYYKGKQCRCFGFEQEFSQEKFDKSYLCYGLSYHCREELQHSTANLEIYRVNEIDFNSKKAQTWTNKQNH